MEPKAKNYAIYPTVVNVGKKTQMTVLPLERVYLLFENTEYTVSVFGVNTDEPDYHTPQNRTTFTCVAHGGVIKFDYTFQKEQEYLVLVSKEGKATAELHLYALNNDLYALKPLRGDLHTHSHRSDGLRDPAALAGYFREQGYDFFALTDHNRFFSGGEIDEVYNGVNTGIKRVTGEEVHFPGNTVHIVHVGGSSSVASLYVKNLAQCEKEVDEIVVPDEVPEIYKRRYAQCKWACDKIHAFGGIAIFAHPYWRTGAKVYNVDDTFSFILLRSGMFDAFELVGGMNTNGINIAVALYAQLAAEGKLLKVVGSSDVHKIAKTTFNNLFTVAFAKENEPSAIVEAVKNGLSVAVEGTGYAYEREYRAFGAHRLVMYTQFLLAHYFYDRQRVCEGEGVVMRAFSMNQAPAALIEMMASQSKHFEDLFFGKKQPAPIDASILAFEDKWRKVQVEEGPNSKGSSINVDPPTMQL